MSEGIYFSRKSSKTNKRETCSCPNQISAIVLVLFIIFVLIIHVYISTEDEERLAEIAL